MPQRSYTYVVVGGGLAGASAIGGIRDGDPAGSILLVSSEKHLPYDRPPLSKQLWLGDKKVEDILVHDEHFYRNNNVELALGATVVGLDADGKTVTDSQGNTCGYEKLLLATGGAPRRLDIPGADLDGVFYYRYLDDYLRLRNELSEGKSAVVIGGGFIGSEMAAALSSNELDVTMVFPDSYICARVFPESLGRAIQDGYVQRGVTIHAGDVAASIGKRGDKLVTRTREGRRIESDTVVVGIGIAPSVDVAETAGLEIYDGLVVNEQLQTSNPDIYAAGDNAFFPYVALGERMRIEHWDNSLNQGRHAGRNLAGADEPFMYMPFFFSDLFEFGYEAVGDVDARLETFADWQKENDTGVIYYLKDRKVRGAMMCNVWDSVDAARELIRSGEQVAPDDLRGAIK